MAFAPRPSIAATSLQGPVRRKLRTVCSRTAQNCGSRWMAAVAWTPVLPEASPVGPLSAQGGRRRAR